MNTSSLSKNKKITLLLFALFFCYGVEWSASIFTQSSVSSWYRDLDKPFWTPPNIAFPIVWTILYTMIGISFWLILCTPKAYTPRVFIAFFGQMLANFTWSLFFFYLQSPFLGFLNIVVLIAAISWNIYVFNIYSKWASKLLIPYWMWVVYAMTLNFGILILN
ncbi:MAG: TspO/MBR family protein [Chlamydiota bacterium]|nr:TspO/MBR family protein [Chlamydiota bacterium]